MTTATTDKKKDDLDHGKYEGGKGKEQEDNNLSWSQVPDGASHERLRAGYRQRLETFFGRQPVEGSAGVGAAQTEETVTTTTGQPAAASLLYFAKPASLSPVVCARFGWELKKDVSNNGLVNNASSSVLLCRSCRCVVVIHFPRPELLSHRVYQRLVCVYEKQLFGSENGGHAEFCSFQKPAAEWYQGKNNSSDGVSNGQQQEAKEVNQEEQKLQSTFEGDNRRLLPLLMAPIVPVATRNLLESPRPLSLFQSQWFQLFDALLSISSSSSSLLACNNNAPLQEADVFSSYWMSRVPKEMMEFTIDTTTPQEENKIADSAVAVANSSVLDRIADLCISGGGGGGDDKRRSISTITTSTIETMTVGEQVSSSECCVRAAARLAVALVLLGWHNKNNNDETNENSASSDKRESATATRTVNASKACHFLVDAECSFCLHKFQLDGNIPPSYKVSVANPDTVSADTGANTDEYSHNKKRVNQDGEVNTEEAPATATATTALSPPPPKRQRTEENKDPPGFSAAASSWIAAALQHQQMPPSMMRAHRYYCPYLIGFPKHGASSDTPLWQETAKRLLLQQQHENESNAYKHKIVDTTAASLDEASDSKTDSAEKNGNDPATATFLEIHKILRSSLSTKFQTGPRNNTTTKAGETATSAVMQVTTNG